jgi:release factor glutamine methyltransferase
MLTQREILKDTVRRFREAQLDSPVLDARLLVEFGLGLDWAALFTGPDRALAQLEKDTLEALIQRRLNHEPVSRIIGRRAFWKLELGISPATLDPRADTETLIMAVLKLRPDQQAAYRILDLGTGSGAILLALLHEYPNASGIGIDVSADAIAVAETNAVTHGMQRRAEFITRDWSGGIEGRFDIVVSNPPYIRSGDIANLAPDVRNFDPLHALDGGSDGLDAYRTLAKVLPGVTAPTGVIALEVGFGQASEVEAIVQPLDLHNLQRWKDIAGIERVITAGF